jgi:hypothetical protein
MIILIGYIKLLHPHILDEMARPFNQRQSLAKDSWADLLGHKLLDEFDECWEVPYLALDQHEHHERDLHIGGQIWGFADDSDDILEDKCDIMEDVK